jgi:glycosyltransferase involved in cell wall biosynthesis
MELSVIIPCLNAGKTLGAQLEALARQKLDTPWELIIADNGSTDDTLQVARTYTNRFANFRIVDASDKPGQPHAMNVGVLQARAEYLAFCDADDEIGDGWLVAMVSALRQDPFVAGALEYKKLNPAWLNASHPQEHGLNRFRYPPFLAHGGSGNMGVRKSVFLSAGGFDEEMPYLFDTDFCFKVQLAGVALRFVPEAIMHIRTSIAPKVIFRKAIGNGEYQVMLYKRYRSRGMPRLSWKAGIRGWWELALKLTQLRKKSDVAAWLWASGWRVGRVKGCIRHRVFAL